jgi:hypothetical protein
MKEKDQNFRNKEERDTCFNMIPFLVVQKIVKSGRIHFSLNIYACVEKDTVLHSRRRKIR